MITLEYLDIGCLAPYERNSKIHPESQINQIEKSIKENGFFDPIHVDENNIILSGHARVEAMINLGYDKIPAILLKGLTEEQRKKIVIAANKIQENGHMSPRALHDEINEILSLNPSSDLGAIGFSLEELDGLLEMDFSPVFDVPIDNTEVTTKGIGVAENKMAAQIDGIQQDKSKDGIEVMCPYCAESFRVTGT